MIVGHIDPNPTLQFRAGKREIRETDVGTIPITTKSITIAFEPFGASRVKHADLKGKTVEWQGVPTSRLPTRFGLGKFLSRCDTEKEAERLKIEVDTLDEWFRNHPSWGRRMLDINVDTAEAVGDEGVGDGIKANGDGSFSCLVCTDKETGDPKYITDGRGLAGHINSNAHKENLANQKEKQVKSFGLGRLFGRS